MTSPGGAGCNEMIKDERGRKRSLQHWQRRRRRPSRNERLIVSDTSSSSSWQATTAVAAAAATTIFAPEIDRATFKRRKETRIHRAAAVDLFSPASFQCLKIAASPAASSAASFRRRPTECGPDRGGGGGIAPKLKWYICICML